MNSWNLQIDGAKAIRLPQDWGNMLRLILATCPMEEIKERLLKLQERKSGQKYLQKLRKWKTFQHIERDDSIQTHGCIDANQEFTRCGIHYNIPHSLEDWRDLLVSLLSPLTPWSTPTPLKKQLWLGGGIGMVECLHLHRPLGS
jgi:hypothetical protein